MLNIPNLFTSLNLFCGFLAIILILSKNYFNAAWLIFIASVFDALDGRIARAFGHSSEFGLQMDSLSDVVSAGLAPSILVYEFHLKNLGYIGLMLSFLPVLMGALRLARFNVTTIKTGKKADYIGLPAPMAALCLGSLVIFSQDFRFFSLHRILIILVPLVSLLMVSTFKYYGFPKFSFKEKGSNRIRLYIFFATLIIFILFPHYVLFPFMLFYILTGPVMALRALLKDEEANVTIIPEEENKETDTFNSKTTF